MTPRAELLRAIAYTDAIRAGKLPLSDELEYVAPPIHIRSDEHGIRIVGNYEPPAPPQFDPQHSCMTGSERVERVEFHELPDSTFTDWLQHVGLILLTAVWVLFLAVVCGAWR